MASVDESKAGLTQDVEGADIAQRIAERVGLRARASAVFGDPVERAGVTVIPVAKATWGFGGGSGGEGVNQGSGGGGGGFVTPRGFIEVHDGDARYVPLRDPRRTALLAGAAAGALGLLRFRRR